MQIDVAPDAKWIAVKIFNGSGKAYVSAIYQGYQWLLNPDGNLQTNDAPNVVNNSWTFGSPGCDLSFEPDLQALVVADITPVFVAGNYGPSSSTGASPANNPDAFASARQTTLMLSTRRVAAAPRVVDKPIRLPIRPLLLRVLTYEPQICTVCIILPPEHH